MGENMLDNRGEEFMFGRWVREERKRRGWTQEELAARIGVAQGYLSHLERAERIRPGGDVLIGLARAFEITVDDLVRAAGLVAPTSPPDELAALLTAARGLLSDELLQAIERSTQDMPADIRADTIRGLRAEIDRARQRATRATEFGAHAEEQGHLQQTGAGAGEVVAYYHAPPVPPSRPEGAMLLRRESAGGC
jgi:transcriptional regulator with XRE-family HTH domain